MFLLHLLKSISKEHSLIKLRFGCRPLISQYVRGAMRHNRDITECVDFTNKSLKSLSLETPTIRSRNYIWDKVFKSGPIKGCLPQILLGPFPNTWTHLFSTKFMGKLKIGMLVVKFFNPFVPNALFLYPLKTSENRKVFLCF